MKNQAIITFGIPASGKSTWTKEYIENDPSFVEVNLDNCRYILSGDEDTQHPGAYAMHNKLIEENIAAKKNIIVSDTNLNKYFRKNLINKFRGAGYEVSIKVFDVDLLTCLDRNIKRGRKVPLEAIEKMSKKFLNQVEMVRNSDVRIME